MKKVTAFLTNGGTQILTCREDDDGNLWVEDCLDNRKELGLEHNRPNAVFGSCFVPDSGSERKARENSIHYYTGEGKNFVVGEHPYAALASQLSTLQVQVLKDSELAAKVANALADIIGVPQPA